MGMKSCKTQVLTKKIFEVISVPTYFHYFLRKCSLRARYDAAGPAVYSEEIIINYCCPACELQMGRLLLYCSHIFAQSYK